MKPLLWMSGTREDLRAFPEDARQRAGYELYQLQRGLEPSDWKPMPSVGPGVREIRIHTRVEHRVIYIAKFAEGVYVLHAFQKKTRRTGRPEIDLAQARLKDALTPKPGGQSMTAKVHRSSGNVFRDLGFTAEEAQSLRLRADLMVQIRRLIERRKLTQVAAAKIFGVTQPRVSDLVRGRIDLFSIDTLVDMLARAGVRVTLTIRRRPSGPRRSEAA